MADWKNDSASGGDNAARNAEAAPIKPKEYPHLVRALQIKNERLRLRLQNAPRIKVCTRCKIELPVSEFHKGRGIFGTQGWCKKYSKEAYREWQTKNPDKKSRNCARYYGESKTRVFAHYGNKCACCGETEILFLTMDHVNDDGGGREEATNSIDLLSAPASLIHFRFSAGIVIAGELEMGEFVHTRSHPLELGIGTRPSRSERLLTDGWMIIAMSIQN